MSGASSNLRPKHKAPSEQNAEVLAQASPRAPAPIKVPWNPVLAVVFAAILFLAAQVVAALLIEIYVMARHLDSRHLTGSVAVQFGMAFFAYGLTALGLFGFVRCYKAGFSILGFVKPKAKDVLYTLGGYLVYVALFFFAQGILKLLIPAFDITQKQEIGFDNVHGLLPLALTFVSLVILPPIVEELLMRGFLFGSLRKHLSFVWAALITGAVFAAAHLPEGGAAGPLWVAAVDTFILSAVLCYLRETTGRLTASIGVHMIKNLVAFMALFVFHLA